MILFRHLVCLAAVALLPACGKESAAPTTKEAPKAAEKPAASVAPSAAPALAVALDALDGPPPTDVKMVKTVSHAKEYALGVPTGWEGANNAYDGMLNVTTKDAAVMLHNVGPGAVSDANRDFWAKGGMASTEIKWAPDAAGTVGKTAIPGKVAKGTGKLEGAAADFTCFRFSAGGFGYLLLVGVKKTASDEVRKQAFATARSIEKK